MNWTAAVILVLGSASCSTSSSDAEPYYLPFQHHLHQQRLVNWEYERYRRGSYYSPNSFARNSFYNPGYPKISAPKIDEDPKEKSIMPPRLPVPESPFPFSAFQRNIFSPFPGFPASTAPSRGSSAARQPDNSDLLQIEDLINLAGIRQPSAPLLDSKLLPESQPEIRKEIKVPTFEQPADEEIFQPEIEILKIDPIPDLPRFREIGDIPFDPVQQEAFNSPILGQPEAFVDPAPIPSGPPRRNLFMPVPAVPGLPVHPDAAVRTAAKPREINMPEIILRAVPAVPGRPVLDQ